MKRHLKTHSGEKLYTYVTNVTLHLLGQFEKKTFEKAVLEKDPRGPKVLDRYVQYQLQK